MKADLFCSAPKPETPTPEPARALDRAAHTLQTIVELRASIGDGLNDEEFSQFVRTQIGRSEDSFSFVAFSQGYVTFTVPPQDLAHWHSASRRLTEEKEERAERIATLFQLTLCEPPDRVSWITPRSGTHHHIELSNHCETIAIAHPLYLKIRLAGVETGRIFRHAHETLPPSIELFRELARLYFS